MVGAGIYVLTGHMIKDRVGPATNLSFLFSGLISIFTGLCYCEFATLIPKAGSCYTYTYLMMGELPAFIIGWTMVMDLIIGMASVAKGFSGAVNLLSNNVVRNFTERYVPLASKSEVWESSVDLLAVLLLFTLFLITLSGANISMNINSVLAMIQICLLSTIIIACFIYGSKEKYVADGGYMPYGFLSIFQGAGIAIFAYSGFETLANSAEETKNPKKSIPIALFTSLTIVIILYVMASTALPYMVPRLQIDVRAPFISAFATNNLMTLTWVSGIATLLATGASKLTSMYIIPRMIYAISEDGLLFAFLGKVDQRTKVPIPGLIVGILLTMILAMFVKIQILADITSMGIILSFVVIGVNLLILRYLHRDPDDEKYHSNDETMKMRVSVHDSFNTRTAFKLMLTSLICTIFLMALSMYVIFPISKWTGIICIIITAMMILFFLIFLSFYEPFSSSESFEVILTISLTI